VYKNKGPQSGAPRASGLVSLAQNLPTFAKGFGGQAAFFAEAASNLLLWGTVTSPLSRAIDVPELHRKFALNQA